MAVVLAAQALAPGGLAQDAGGRQPEPRKPGLSVWERGLLARDAETRSSSAVSLLDSAHPDAYRILLAALAADKPLATRSSVLKAAGFRRDDRLVKAAGECLASAPDDLCRVAARYLASAATTDAYWALSQSLSSKTIPASRKVLLIEALEGYSSRVVVEVLIGQLDSPDADVRRAVAAALERIAGQRLGDDKAAWLKWWEANRDLTRERWLEAVVEIQHKDVRDLKTRERELTREVARVHQRLFSVLKGEQLAAELSGSLASPHAAVRFAAATAAGNAGLKSAVPGLRQCLGDQSAEVRAAAALALGLIDDGPIPELVALLSDEAPAVQAAAAKALGRRRSADAVDALRGLVKSKDDEVAEASIDALGQIAAPKANPQLVEALTSPSPRVREAAARALGATSASADPPVAQAAARGLVQALEDPSERVRWYAIQGLGQMGAQYAEGALIAKFRDESPRVRESAANALGAMGSLKAQSGLVALLADGDERVAKQAGEALVALAGKHPEQARALGRTFFDRGDFARAAGMWAQHLKAAATPHEQRSTRRDLARAYAAMGDWPEVVVHLTEALKVPNGQPDLLAELAQAQAHMGAFTQAGAAHLRFMQAAAKPTPEHWRLALRIAQGLRGKKDAVRAAEFVSGLRKAHPDLGGPDTKGPLSAIEVKAAPAPAPAKPAP